MAIEIKNMNGQAIFVYVGNRLSHADLRNANLRGADLSNVDLHGANLQGAILRDANFRGADLTNADLRGASREGADFRFAKTDGCVWDFGDSGYSTSDYAKVAQSLKNLKQRTNVKAPLFEIISTTPSTAPSERKYDSMEVSVEGKVYHITATPTEVPMLAHIEVVGDDGLRYRMYKHMVLDPYGDVAVAIVSAPSANLYSLTEVVHVVKAKDLKVATSGVPLLGDMEPTYGATAPSGEGKPWVEGYGVDNPSHPIADTPTVSTSDFTGEALTAEWPQSEYEHNALAELKYLESKEASVTVLKIVTKVIVDGAVAGLRLRLGTDYMGDLQVDEDYAYIHELKGVTVANMFGTVVGTLTGQFKMSQLGELRAEIFGDTVPRCVPTRDLSAATVFGLRMLTDEGFGKYRRTYGGFTTAIPEEQWPRPPYSRRHPSYVEYLEGAKGWYVYGGYKIKVKLTGKYYYHNTGLELEIKTAGIFNPKRMFVQPHALWQDRHCTRALMEPAVIHAVLEGVPSGCRHPL